MARALTPTILPLDSWAAHLGISPVYFNGGVSASGAFAGKNDQQPIWFQFDWQASAQYSRESLARLIQKSERDITKFVNYLLAPDWTSAESHPYSSLLNTRYAKVITGGRRATTLIGTAVPAFSDPDSDGFDELATISIATTVTDPCELHLYFTGYDGVRQWEIRPLIDVEITAGVATITVDSWKLFKPSLQNAIPVNGANPIAIPADDAASYVANVEVRRVFTDPESAAVQFVWNCPTCGSSGCASCQSVAQDGCMQLLDPEAGLVNVYPATYDSTEGSWVKADWTVGREPDRVNIWYKSGLQENLAVEGAQCDELSYDMAYLIAILSASRIEYFFGANNNVQSFVSKLQQDLALSGGDVSHFLPVELARNPFGTKYGEIEVYKSLATLRERVYHAASMS